MVKNSEEHTTDRFEVYRDTIDNEITDEIDITVPYLVVLAGGSVGRVIRMKPGVPMKAGRTRTCELYFDCDNISREHAMFTLDATGKTTLKDLGSTNGTLVNGKRVDEVSLQDGDRVCLGNIILRYSLKDTLEFDFQQDLYDKATKDPLTGIFNKRYFLENGQKEFAFHRRQEMPMSLMILDLDDFKRLNDTFGHVNGDIVLKTLAKEVSSCMRHEDLFARFGGEEFVGIFRCTPLTTAERIANKLLELISSLKFSTPTLEFSTSATIGLAALESENFESLEEMLITADSNLYIGKRKGKNRVVS